MPSALTLAKLGHSICLYQSTIDRGAGALITLPELLEDQRYRKFFTTVPRTLVPAPGQQPWRLYIQRSADGPWLKKEYERYADAFRRLAVDLRADRVHDGAIQSRGIAFGPPNRVAKVTKGGRPVMVRTANGTLEQKTVVTEWKPRVDPYDAPHTWCTYCRRPTVFKWFHTHHALRGSAADGLVDPSNRRCTICGAREEFVRATLRSARPPGYNPAAAPSKRRSRS